jgi:hypothetical protein
MLSLRSIAGWEDAVLASIAGAQGTPEERDQQIERSGMYGEYPAIVRAYQELFSDADSAGEAVKRAVFLVWAGALFPPMQTGIAPLPDGTVRSVFDALCSRVRDFPDEELMWMLAWYHARSPDLFDLYGATRDLMDRLDASSPEDWRDAGVTAQGMAGRGQMGRYWAEKANGAR